MSAKRTLGICILSLALMFTVVSSMAQQRSLSIREAVQRVQANLPQLAAYRHQASASAQNIRLIKNTLMPELTAGYQAELATYNNITGMSYPGYIMSITGPPTSNSNLNFVPGSALGAILKWNPLTFGQRQAAESQASASFAEANARYSDELFEYQCSTINTYLEIVYLKQVMLSQRGAIDRNAAELDQAAILAKNGLKPGIDTTQFQSAITQSEIEYLQTEKLLQSKLIELGKFTGLDLPADQTDLTDSLSDLNNRELPDSLSPVTSHPYYQTVEAQKNVTRASLQQIQKSWVPQLDIWGDLFSRGSGIDYKGNINNGDGFNLSRSNAGIGFQISFPVLQYSRVNIKKKQYTFLLQADESRLAQAQLDIISQRAVAGQQYRQDLKIALKSPLLLRAARDVYQGLRISYESGLIDYARLSEAQYELLRAEVNLASARLQVWRSLLGVSVAQGDLHYFLGYLK